jgi:nucleoside-diphosphate-sugar epimerase
VTLRPPFVYGPENPFYREAFFWDRLLAGRPILIPGDGLRLMQFVLADDLALAAIRAAETESAVGRAYNIGNYPPLTQVEAVTALARVAGKQPRLVHVPREKILEAGGQVFRPPYYFGQYFDMPPITCKTGRARRELGFQPTPFEEGLQQTFGWYQARGGRSVPDVVWEDSLLSSLAGGAGPVQ